MAWDIMKLAATPCLGRLAEGQASLVVSARLWVALRKSGQDPAPAMTQRLGAADAAWRFWLLMEEVGTAWPDPFLVSPPCCRRLNFDEAVLLDMVHHAARRDRIGFIRLVEDMLAVEIAERLYRATRAFVAALPQPAGDEAPADSAEPGPGQA